MLLVERAQECVADRSPPVGIEPQQMAVAGNAVEQLEARAAAGGDEGLMVFADQGLVVEAIVVGIEPQLQHLVGRAAAGIRI